MNASLGWRRARPPLRLLIVPAALIVCAGIALVPPFYLLAALLIVLATAICLRYPVAGFCLLSFSVPWSSALSIPGLPGQLTTTDFLIALLGSAWLVAFALYGSRVLEGTSWLPFLLLFVFAIVLSTSQAIDRQAALRECVKWIELCFVYVAGVYFIRTKQNLRHICGALVAAGVSQALFGYVQSGLQLGPAAFVHGLFLRAYGTFDQPNPYAGYLNLILPLALSFSILGERKWERWVYRLATLLLLGALVASESRGALLAMLLAVVVMLTLIWRPIRPLAQLGLLAVAGFGWLASYNLIPLQPVQRVLTAIGLGSVAFGQVTNANFSAVERAAHWLAGVRMFASHPLLGVGIGNYAVAYPHYHPRGWYASLAHAHNYYINIAAEAGIVGLLAYLLLAGTALWYTWAATRHANSNVCRAVALGVLGALITVSVHNFFDVLYVHGMVALLGLLMALVAVSVRSGSVLDPTTATA
jgi:O-antigen ligase